MDSNGLPYPDTEVEVQDLYVEPTFASYLDAELTTAGLNWATIKEQFIWHDITYTPVIYLENGAVADWSLPPLIGIGTDLDVDLLDEFADFIPVFDNECNENNEYEPNEVMIGKIDPLAVTSHPDPPVIESQCLERPC